MSTTTTNYGLIKPDITDPILIGQLNDNADTIDATMKSISDALDVAKLGIKYKGEVYYYSDLPSTGNQIGDAYTVKYSGTSGTTPDGTEYVWGTVSGTNQWINFSKDSYTKAEVDALLALKQNALTTAQLAAVNSGIDSTKVAQIETNKNNISLNTAEITGQQNATTDTVAGRGYAIINGQRLYMGTAQMPERTGDIWIDGATVRESEYLLTTNPLCGISTYKDTLNLATGGCSRQIDKLELTGTEEWRLWSTGYNNTERFFLKWNKQTLVNQLICSHIPFQTQDYDINHIRLGGEGFSDLVIYISKTIAATAEEFKTYLQQQYAADTPVTVWYILATPATETITVPSGNTGTVEGYLIQDGTPTPTAPVYPSANEVIGWSE